MTKTKTYKDKEDPIQDAFAKSKKKGGGGNQEGKIMLPEKGVREINFFFFFMPCLK